jgi:hypothetical protein
MLLSSHGYFYIGISVGIDDDVFAGDKIQEFRESIIRLENLTGAVVHKCDDTETKPEDIFPATGFGIHINLSQTDIATIFMADARGEAAKLRIKEIFEPLLTKVGKAEKLQIKEILEASKLKVGETEKLQIKEILEASKLTNVSELEKLLDEIFETLPTKVGEAEKELEEIFEAFKLTKVKVTIFSLGIIYFCIEVEIGNINLQQKLIEDISYFLQNAVWEKFSEALKKIASCFVTIFKSENDPINNISFKYYVQNADREMLHYYITPSVFLLVCGDDDDFEKVAETVKGLEGESEQKRFKYGNSPIAFGMDWYILDKHDDEDYDRVMSLIEFSQVFFAINEAFEELFRDGMKEVLKGDLMATAKKMNARDLNQRRMLAATIIAATSYSLCASRSTDLDFLRHFEEKRDLWSKQNQIKYVADIFSQAQIELNEIEEKKRSAKLNFFIIGLTTLTFLSVLADIINTVDPSQRLLPSLLSRIMTLSIPFFLLLLLLWIYGVRTRRLRNVEKTNVKKAVSPG